MAYPDYMTGTFPLLAIAKKKVSVALADYLQQNQKAYRRVFNKVSQRRSVTVDKNVTSDFFGKNLRKQNVKDGKG